MKKRLGIEDTDISVRGNTSIIAGIVTDHKKVGCPPCDTVFIRLTRDGKETLFMAVTPEEAGIIAGLLTSAGIKAAERG